MANTYINRLKTLGNSINKFCKDGAVINRAYVGNLLSYGTYPTKKREPFALKLICSGVQTITMSSEVSIMEYSFDGSNWTEADSATPITFGTSSQPYVYLRGQNGVFSSGLTWADASVPMSIEGKAMALIDYTNPSRSNIPAGAFVGTFVDYSGLTTVSKTLFSGVTECDTYSCMYMFKNCINLTQAPDLPAEYITEGSYYQMFYGCSSLVNGPAISANTVAGEAAMSAMFRKCTSLTGLSTDILLPSELSTGCYMNMFESCSSLVSAPILPADTLVETCYKGMFKNCSALTSITSYATDISASDCTNNWVKSVAASGNFYGYEFVWEEEGDSGYPTGWTLEPPF